MAPCLPAALSQILLPRALLDNENKEEKMKGKGNPKEIEKQKKEVVEKEVIINQKQGRASPIHPN